MSRHSGYAMGIALLFTQTAHAQAASQPGEWSAVDQAIGRSGTIQSDGAMKYGFPRSDLDVSLDGVRIKPALALGSWVAFKKVGRDAMAMGDLVLTEGEVSAVVGALQQNSVWPTAVHNHLLRESPRIVYVHIAAHGNGPKIAAAIRNALALTATPGPAAAPTALAPTDLDTAMIHRTLGSAGKVNGGVYQVSVPRRDPIRMDGEVILPSMGISTAMNFQPTGSGRAAITGDFVMHAAEVNRVMSALRGGNIAITALHSHMIGEEPRLYFMHFWANDDVQKLTGALRQAIDLMK